MDIIVPIKQVPETGNVQMDPETGTMIRAGVETVVNPLDLYAIEAAIRLKEAHGGTITVLSMHSSPDAQRSRTSCPSFFKTEDRPSAMIRSSSAMTIFNIFS